MAVPFDDIFSFFASAPYTLVMMACLVHAPLGKWWDDFFKEFVGTIVMILAVFPAGKWLGTGSRWEAWLWHGLGVVAADWVAGGPCVNPSVTLGLLALGKLSYPAFLCRVAAQLGGGLAAFSLGRRAAHALALPALGGPCFDPGAASRGAACRDELIATFVLCFAVFVLNWELPVRRYYIVKQGLTAAVVRFNIQMFTAAGPAMNPMLGTTWAIFLASEEQTQACSFALDYAHFLYYWVSSFVGALLASLLYAAIKSEPMFGYSMHPTIGKIITGTDVHIKQKEQ